MNTVTHIPNYVIDWTDKYFHQSAFDVLLNYPSTRVIKFLASFTPKKPNKIKLYRGVNTYNNDSKGVTSWTHDRRIAERYAKGIGDVIEMEFPSDKILLDTTRLTKAEKEQFGYDYKIDDKEVLILEI